MHLFRTLLIACDRSTSQVFIVDAVIVRYVHIACRIDELGLRGAGLSLHRAGLTARWQRDSPMPVAIMDADKAAIVGLRIFIAASYFFFWSAGTGTLSSRP